MNKNTRLVYSTETGRIKESKEKSPNTPVGDGRIRIRLETKGRKGKGVTVISGMALCEAEVKDLAKKLKQVCGCGGSVKNGEIEIQGDKRETIKAELIKLGLTK